MVGSANADLVLRLQRIPKQGETLLADSLDRGCGGKGANQAVACARDGAEVIFLGAVGADAEGDSLRTAMRGEGIDVSLLRTVDIPTGMAMVLVADGDNSIVVHSGANAALSGLLPAEQAVVRDAAVVLLQLEIPLPAVLEASRVATGLVVFNAAPARELPAELLGAVDVLVVNESEAAIVGADDLDVPVVITTLGAAGVRLARSGHPDVTYPARTVTAIDTTAAGDTFCGVLAAGLARGAGWPAAIVRAIVASSLTVQRPGAQESIPPAADTDAALLGHAD